MKKIDGVKIIYARPKDFLEKDKITKQCVEIADKAGFSTDYADVYDHLFGSEDLELFVIVDEFRRIYGYTTFFNLYESNNTYVSGMMLHPQIQGMGFSEILLKKIVEKHDNCYLTCRTQNPRVYELMYKVAYNGIIFPNIFSDEIPKEVKNILPSHPALKEADDNLIVKEAYPDKKIEQMVKKSEIYSIFSKLGSKDAQVIIVCTRKPDFD